LKEKRGYKKPFSKVDSVSSREINQYVKIIEA